MEILNRSHSVRLDESKCLGCTTCIRTCPTEAIRVRNGKAYILDHKCIDCGVCIRTCPERAKRAVFDPLERMQEFRYTVALPAPTLYGQYNNLDDVDVVLTALLRMGFDAVCEVAGAAEMVSDYTRRLLEFLRNSEEGANTRGFCKDVVIGKNTCKKHGQKSFKHFRHFPLPPSFLQFPLPLSAPQPRRRRTQAR